MRIQVNYVIAAAVLGGALLAATGCPHSAATTSARRAAPPPAATQPEAIPDQINIQGWNKAWTNLLNDVEQPFTPALPKLQAVEVWLVVGNPGPSKALLTLSILDSKGRELSVVRKLVAADNCDIVRFWMATGGVSVNPGQSYRIKLSGDQTFGWKYIVGGYPKGGATFNGRPLLADASSSFLFETFGSN